ncbi:5-amino-6-(5-phosphoribosylamino)uracil reductase [Zalerion maritima]|uniref:2,5-diamino-6-ribosylamino-4(3H)-pyrimidinone 5'-phosphate reductase n=1 Tax=Zalerion maritima TaxID=339359 RepID=A0AAD5S1P2_9PEZI|nr:5-amino-6-(5-phosphoribosylamino)uracil reductase [Zalerion maritima]
MVEQLDFPLSMADKLKAYLPPTSDACTHQETRVWTTLTFATSLDSSLALAPGVRTVLSGPESKAMTHYLRSRHDAILVGVGTAVADNPGLNCRISDSQHHPRPVVLDPNLRWDINSNSKVLQLAAIGSGMAPWVVTSVPMDDISQDKQDLLCSYGGKYIHVPLSSGAFEWTTLLEVLRDKGIRSVMVEGGGQVINSLLAAGSQAVVDGVIVTIAPTWLGGGGVVVCPDRQAPGLPAARLRDVKWLPMGDDVVLCGRLGG